MPRSVLFLLPYPLHSAPSQRFRVEAYFDLLREQGISFTTSQLLDNRGWYILYKKRSWLTKAWTMIKGYGVRIFVILFKCRQYQFIFIHREAVPFGPPIFEWLLAKVFRKKIIFDFDDAIWIPNITAGNQIARYIKCFWKIKYICKWSYKVSVGNDFLAEWALKYNTNVVVNPTVVDMETRYNQTKKQNTDKVVIGWTGSHSTLKYLDSIVPVLQRLEAVHDFCFLVISNETPNFQLRSLQFIPWNKATEIEDLMQMHIGIMPLQNDAWSEGKCGFKLIQYLALGIPAIASPIGVNKKIIRNGQNGFLCETSEEWYQALKLLLEDQTLREKFGANGQKKMRASFSLQSNAGNFLSLFS